MRDFIGFICTSYVRQSVEQLRAAIIYVVLNIIGSWIFLLGIGLLYKTVGTLNFTQIALRLDQMQDNKTIIIISLVFIVAFGSKAALVIFMWLPKAYAVLNTELAALFAALMTKVGAYALIRFSLCCLINILESRIHCWYLWHASR